ncbi:MAG: type II CAAX endopeptidase family protein [Terricaulis sp.]
MGSRAEIAGPLGWPLVRLAVYAGAALATIIVTTILFRLFVPPEPSPLHELGLLKNVILPVALFAIYAGLVRLMERRSAQEVNFLNGLPTLLLGVLIGAAIISTSVLVLWKLGMAEIAPSTGLAGVERDLLVLMITSMSEELLFRVILFAIFEEIVGSLGAILLSAAAFGLAHAGNPGATPFALFALSVELGVMLALAYMLTRNVWIAVGAHAGWNFTQGFVFGALNSGQRHPQTFFQTSFTGPEFLTGGTFGLEGSVVTLGLCVAVSVVLLALISHKRQWLGIRLRFGSNPAVSRT